jgi:hypothetical protein
MLQHQTDSLPHKTVHTPPDGIPYSTKQIVTKINTNIERERKRKRMLLV